MEPWLAALIILGVAALSAAGMLLVRRRAPAGTFFNDPIPGGAVYTVAGTAYMVILAFVFFIAFESYGGAKSDAEDEATATSRCSTPPASSARRPARARGADDVLCARGHLGRLARDAGRRREFGRGRQGLSDGGVRRADPGQRRQTGRRL